MYRVSPFTYLVSGMMSTGLANSNVICSSIEYLHFNPPAGDTCESYMKDYISYAGGYVLNGSATSDCQFCSVADTNVFLANVNSDFKDAWRNFGLMFVFIIFNIFGAIGMYWLARVPKNAKKEKKE
jgi:ATP-binding cassette subfamily G (WHITE) protein 2 (PDR)